MRTPLQILTSISTATSAFVLPLVLATSVPAPPSDPKIEPMFQELELIIQLEQSEPETQAAATPDAERPEKSAAETRDGSGPKVERPESELEDAAKRAQEASAQTVRSTASRGSIYARVAIDRHVRPDRTLASSVRKTKSQGKRRKACLEPVSGISETGAWRYDVERDLLDNYTGNLRQASTLALTSWHRSDGEIDGFRVKKVRCGSPLHQLGFRNGDVVHSVNGKPVTSTTQALMAFRKLRRNDRLTLLVTGWKGEHKTLRFRMI